MTIQELYQLILSARLPFGNEMALQDAIEQLLVQSGMNFSREFRLPKGPIDFLCHGGIGIECKVDGSPSAVLVQLQRYAHDPQLTGLILVTSRHTHRFNATEIGGKPFMVAWVAGGAL